MKKFTFLTTALALFAFLAIPLGMRGQTTATFEPADFSGQGTSGTGSAISATVDGVTFACNKGYGTTQIRCYKDGVITISSENEITALDFTFSGTYNGGLETSYSDLSTYSWEYTLTSQARFTEIVVTYSGTPAETHTLYFSPNEWGYGTIAVGDNTSGTISLAEGATVDITATATDHHAFMFWEIEEGEGSSVANEYSTSTTFTMGTEDATLVGNFYALTTYTVFYEPNMAGVQDIMVTYDEGDDVIVAANTFTNPGYVFTGWNTEGDGTGDSYQPNDTIEDIQDDILLYAQWEQTTEVVDVLNWAATGSPTNYTDWTYTAPSGAAYKGQSSGTYQSIQLRSSNNNSGIVTTTSIGNVTKVTVAWNSNTVNGRTLNVYGSNTAYTSPTQLYGDNIVGDLLGTIVCGTDTVLNITGNYAYIGLRSAANAMYLDKIKITWASDGVLPPSITADDVEIQYNATSGSFTFTVSNPVEGGNLTVAENVEWIDEAEINTLTNGYSVTFATTVNEAGMAREGVITLTYSYNRQTVTKDVTVTQAGNPNVVDNISDITEVGADYHVKGMVVGASNKGFVICDGTGLVYTYLNAVPTYQVGNFVQITGTTGSYGHVIQFTNSATFAEADVFTFDLPEYSVITEVPDYTEGYHLSDYFQFEGTLTKSGTNYLVAVGEGQIRISYPTTEQAEDLETLLNKTVRIHGFFTGYSGTGENAVFTAMMESYEEVVAPAVPSITIDPDSFSLDANSHMGESLTQIAYQNIIVVPGSGYNTFAAHYYDAEGQETAYDWCVVGALAQADADSVFNFAVFLDPNVGDEARTAYIKLSALDTDNNQVYSNRVTITQAAPVLDYAVLPFEWEGGSSAAFLALNGTTLSGNGSDYNANNHAPYLIKLDGNGDYIQVKTDSQPGTVSIGVKMIGGSNTSTITIQGSADGETFTDIETLTISGNTNDTLTLETTNAFDANDRYVRMVFTKGSNVGVGPITITKGTAPSINVTPATIDLAATGTMSNGMQMQIFDITYYNLDISGNSDFAVQFYDAEGEAQTQPAWIMGNVSVMGSNEVGYTISLIIAANDGAARSTYFKVYAQTVYSNLVTVNQAAAPSVTHTVTFNENGQVAETLEIAEGEMGDNLPTAAFGTVPANSKFVGWSLTPVTDYTAGNYFTTEAPVMVDTTYNLTGDVTFYAVYATVRQEEYGEKGWVKITSTDRFLAGDRFLMVNETHGKVAGDIEQQVMQPYDATFEDGLITSELPDSIFVLWLWNQGIEGSWTLRYYSPGYDSDLNGSWLAATAAKKLTWIAPTDTASYNKSQYSWFISFDNDGNVIIQNGVQEYGRFLYNASSPRFTTYTSNPSSIMLLPQLYRYQGVYTEYNDYYFSQITEQNESVDITDNVVWPYNYTISDNAIVNIEENGLLSVEGLLFNTDPTQLVIKDGGQLKISNKVRAGTIQKNIIGYVNEETNNGNYYLLGLPMNWSYDKAVASGMVGLFPNFGDVDVYHFSPNKDGEEWGNLKAYGDPEPTLAGIYAYFGSNVHQPYLYANKNDVVLSFATEATEATDGFYATNVDESEPASRMSGHNFTGWNLIRNPYTCNAYLRSGRDFYRMNDAGDAIVLATDNVIKPCEAIFVVVAAENDPEQTANYPGVVMARVYFTTTEPTPAGDESKLEVKLSRNGQVLDVARVRFDEGDMNGKMVLNEGTTRLSIAQGNKDYSIVRSQGQGEMPVSFKADANGTYTISVDADNMDMNYMHLIDNMTGADVDLLQTPSYSFEASIGDYASRFRLVFSGASTGTAADENFAFFSNGNLVITNDGNATLQVIDLTGRVLSSKTISGSCSTSIDAPTGVYMLRLINGDNVKVQKVVVR